MSDPKTETQTPNVNQKRPRVFWRNTGIFLGTLSFIVVLAVMGYGLYRLFLINQHLAVGVMQTQQQVENVKQDSAQAMQQMTDALKQQETLIATLREQQTTNQEDMRVLEAEFQVRMANDSLQFDSNVRTAIKLLEQADRELSSIAMPDVMTIRKAIASDLAELKNVTLPDVSSLYLQMSQLIAQVPELPLMSQSVSVPSAEALQDQEKTGSWWKRALASVKLAFQHLVVVRKNNLTQPFIAPDQKVVLYQNLQAQLQQAQWALVHQMPVIYQASLNQASVWMKQYVLQESPKTQHMMSELVRLQQINLQPSIPVLTNSLQAFQDYTAAHAAKGAS